MKLLTICIASFLLFSCSKTDNTGRIEYLKVLQTCVVSKCAEGDQQLGRMLDIISDKSASPRFLEKTTFLYDHMTEADSLSNWLISELNTRRRKLINANSSKSNRLNKPIGLEYSSETEFNESALPTDKQIAKIIKEIEIYRNELCKTLVESQLLGLTTKPFYFNVSKVIQFETKEQKTESIRASIRNSRICEDDMNAILLIMKFLTEKKSTWEAMLDSDQDWIDLSMGLLSIQQKILTARNLVFHTINMRSGCHANFNITKFTPLVVGTENALPNDTVNFEVMFVGYNEYFDHQVTVSEGARFIENKDGKSYFQAVVPNSGKLELNGEIKVERKSGYSNPIRWSHTINVLEPK